MKKREFTVQPHVWKRMKRDKMLAIDFCERMLKILKDPNSHIGSFSGGWSESGYSCPELKEVDGVMREVPGVWAYHGDNWSMGFSTYNGDSSYTPEGFGPPRSINWKLAYTDIEKYQDPKRIMGRESGKEILDKKGAE